jgi:hypothetical protein
MHQTHTRTRVQWLFPLAATGGFSLTSDRIPSTAGPGGTVISIAQIPAGRMYMEARKFPVMS